MRIAGFTPFSLSDFPGYTAAIVFTQGCNFRCPFCHNHALMEMNADVGVNENTIRGILHDRRNRLDGVVVSGGEPTLQEDIISFFTWLKTLGFKTKLDTNGSRPRVIGELIEKRLVDYVAMDVKAPPDKYNLLSGTRVDWKVIKESICLLSESGVAHEFRTTVVNKLLSETDMEKIKDFLPPISTYKTQNFISKQAFDLSLRNGQSQS